MSDSDDDQTPFAKKSLGQHFLFDPDILRRIALATGPLEGKSIIEVGPGPGGLTRAILDEGAKNLLCVEADDRFASALATWPEVATGRMHIVHGDATKCVWQDLVETHGLTQPVNIIANLPYNVGTRLVIDWLKAGDWRGVMAVMLQKEVVERFCAAPSTPAYGRLSVMAGAVCHANIAMTLPPGAFRPPPKVDSAVVLLSPLPKLQQFDDLDALETVCAKAFGQRRKMLRKSLQTVFAGNPATPILEQIGIDPLARPETLTQNEFRVLAKAWRRYNAPKYV